MGQKENVNEIISNNGYTIVIKDRKSSVILEIAEFTPNKDYDCRLDFDKESFGQMVDLMEQAAYRSWAGLEPKEATSVGSDYDEYYDKEFDNNGYLSIGSKGSYRLNMSRPWKESNRFYKFNKSKMAAFIYDLKKHQGEWND